MSILGQLLIHLGGLMYIIQLTRDAVSAEEAAGVYTCVCVRVSVSVCVCVCTYIHTYISAYVYTYIHTCMHTYIHTHTHTVARHEYRCARRLHVYILAVFSLYI